MVQVGSISISTNSKTKSLLLPTLAISHNLSPRMIDASNTHKLPIEVRHRGRFLSGYLIELDQHSAKIELKHIGPQVGEDVEIIPLDEDRLSIYAKVEHIQNQQISLKLSGVAQQEERWSPRETGILSLQISSQTPDTISSEWLDRGVGPSDDLWIQADKHVEVGLGGLKFTISTQQTDKTGLQINAYSKYLAKFKIPHTERWHRCLCEVIRISPQVEYLDIAVSFISMSEGAAAALADYLQSLQDQALSNESFDIEPTLPQVLPLMALKRK